MVTRLCDCAVPDSSGTGAGTGKTRSVEPRGHHIPGRVDRGVARRNLGVSRTSRRCRINPVTHHCAPARIVPLIPKIGYGACACHGQHPSRYVSLPEHCGVGACLAGWVDEIIIPPVSALGIPDRQVRCPRPLLQYSTNGVCLLKKRSAAIRVWRVRGGAERTTLGNDRFRERIRNDIPARAVGVVAHSVGQRRIGNGMPGIQKLAGRYRSDQTLQDC